MELPIISCDLDGVLASWDHGTFDTIGPPIPGAKEFLRELSKVGRVVLCTCRMNSKLYDSKPIARLRAVIRDWLKKHDMQQYISDIYTEQVKMWAACYIDDKAIHCDPEQDDDYFAFRETLCKVKAMCKNGKQCVNKGIIK